MPIRYQLPCTNGNGAIGRSPIGRDPLPSRFITIIFFSQVNPPALTNKAIAAVVPCFIFNQYRRTGIQLHVHHGARIDARTVIDRQLAVERRDAILLGGTQITIAIRSQILVQLVVNPDDVTDAGLGQGSLLFDWQGGIVTKVLQDELVSGTANLSSGAAGNQCYIGTDDVRLFDRCRRIGQPFKMGKEEAHQTGRECILNGISREDTIRDRLLQGGIRTAARDDLLRANLLENRIAN